MLAIADTVLDGTRYQITQLPLGISRPIFFKLLKVCGPALAGSIKSITDAKSLGDLDLAVLGQGLDELITRLDYSFFNELVLVFAGTTVIVDGSSPHGTALKATIETTAFDGDYGKLCRWLGFCLKHNFAGFLAGWALIERPARAAAELAAPLSPST